MTGTKTAKPTKQAPDFPGVKQQQEANEKAEAAADLSWGDKAALKAIRQEDTNKKMLLTREKENFTKIYALKCYNGWLKICDNSAIKSISWS